jgi:hypothetical protein
MHSSQTRVVRMGKLYIHAYIHTYIHTSRRRQPSETHLRMSRQGLRQASGSICWQAARRGECCNKSGHDSDRKRCALVWPHAQKVNESQRNVCCQAGWGKGGHRERQAACCAEEEDMHDEASYADATSVARLFLMEASQGHTS